MVSSREALQRLEDGNRRFVDGAPERVASCSRDRLAEVLDGQEPLAIVLSCSDSRVPPELVFDQGVGDLFVIRVAGHVAGPAEIGSIEFAAQQFGTGLIVVLGHSSCGAVAATIEEVQSPSGTRSKNLDSIVDHIRPLVEVALDEQSKESRSALVDRVVRANIEAAVRDLRHGSEVLRQLAEQGQLQVVGAYYSLETGVVSFIDDATTS